MNTTTSLDLDPIPPEILEEYYRVSEPKASELPPDVSLDFVMTKQNLFAVWSCPTYRMKMIKADAGMCIDWILADEPHAWEQIKTLYPDNNVAAAISLENLENLVSQLHADCSGLWGSLLSKIKKVHAIEKSGQIHWSSDKPTSPEGTLVMTGKISDLDKVLTEGLSIFAQRKYRGLFDARPVEPGHPKDWIRFMGSPKGALGLREMRLEYLGNDGTK